MMLNDDDDMEEVNCPQVNDTTKTRRASIVWIILLQTWMMLLISRLLVLTAEPSTQVLVVVVAAFDRICFLQLLQIWVIESVVCVVCTLIYFCCSGCWLPDWLTAENRGGGADLHYLAMSSCQENCCSFESDTFAACASLITQVSSFCTPSREQERITKWDQELMVVQLELLLGERIKITLREVRRSAALISIIFCLIN